MTFADIIHSQLDSLVILQLQFKTESSITVRVRSYSLDDRTLGIPHFATCNADLIVNQLRYLQERTEHKRSHLRISLPVYGCTGTRLDTGYEFAYLNAVKELDERRSDIRIQSAQVFLNGLLGRKDIEVRCSGILPTADDCRHASDCRSRICLDLLDVVLYGLHCSS